MFFFFAAPFKGYFSLSSKEMSSPTKCIFYFSYRLKINTFTCILLGHIEGSKLLLFKVPYILILISRNLYLPISLYSLSDILLSVSAALTIAFRILNHNIWSIALYFSINLDCYALQNSCFCFCYQFYFASTSGCVMVSKLDLQNWKSAFESHWVPH